MAYAGRALRINLDTATTDTFEIPAAISERYLGGRGFNSALLYHMVHPDTPARSQDNPILLTPGVLAGTPSFATGGFVVTTRSSLTGGLVHSWAVGDWGAALKRAGYDLIWIVGQAAAWLYLAIDNDEVELYPADQLNGLDTIDIMRRLQATHGDDARVLTLGPAGERILPYASLVAEGRYMAEPAGAGVVMAHKRLKAIVVRGTRMIKPADPKAFMLALKPISERLERDPLAEAMRQFGSSYYVDQALKAGALTGRNGQDPAPAHPAPFARAAWQQRARQEPHGCPRCPMPCYSDYIVDDAPVPRPEVEAIAGFGARCGLESADAILSANDRCLRYGLDPSATANAIAFLMECHQRGMTKQYPLRWGDEQGVLEAIDAIAGKTGVGGLLSLGAAEMSSIFFESEQFAPAANGMPLSPLDPRAAQGWALHLATAATGGDARLAMPWYEWLPELPAWLSGDNKRHDPPLVEGKAARLVWHERFAAGLDAAGMCRRMGLLAYQIAPAELAELLAADLGRPISPAELARVGERIVTVERLLAIQWGHQTALPARWSAEPLAAGPAAGALPELPAMLEQYYARHGWSEEGLPPPARLADLGIPEPDARTWAIA